MCGTAVVKRVQPLYILLVHFYKGEALADSVSSDDNAIKTNQCTGLQQYTVSPLYFLLPSGFPCYDRACFLGVRKIKTTGACTGLVNRTLLLPVHSVPVPGPTFFMILPQNVFDSTDSTRRFFC